jgi:hypothetical protein
MTQNNDFDISLIKGKRYSLVYFLLIILIFIGATVGLLIVIQSASQKIPKLTPVVDDSVEIVDVKFTIEELGNYTIQGKVINNSDIPRKGIMLKFNLLDDNNNIVQSISYAVGANKELLKSLPEPFIIIGENIGGYFKQTQKIKLSYYVESFM